MTSALPEKTGVPKMLMPELFPARFHQVLDGICRTQRMMILYGDIVSQECGLPGMDGSINVSYGQDSRRMPLRSLIRDLKPSKAAPPETQNLYMVASLNRALAERRVAVRSTQPGEFSRFLTRMRLEKKLVMAVTTSFDASEAVHDPQMENKLAMLHGDNRQLRCYRKGCAGVLATDTHQLETLLLGTDHLEDGGTARLCPGCWKKYRKANKQVRVGNERTYTLRPPVEVDVTDDMLVGKGKEVLIRAAEECQLLLMVGISLKSQRLRELTQDLGDAIHANSGAVLYANPEPLKGRNLFDHIDFHVPLDPDQLIGCVLEQMDKRSAPGFGEVEPVNNEADFWTDIIGSQVMEAARALEQPYGGPCCRNCGCGVEGYLIGCRRCATAYCCRRVNYDESNEAQVGEDGEIVPLDAPGMDNEGDGGEGDGEVDTFELLDACIVLNQYSSDGRRPRLAAAKREFVCRSCWDCETQGLYPHYVKPSISLLAHPSTGEHTKLVMIIFYVEQFWPQAQHLTNLIAGRWETKGWPCFVKPIKLEHMEEQSSFERPSYESGTYELFVVYITHGLTGDQGYQIAHGKALEPLPFLQRTVGTIGDLFAKALSKRAFVFCCGHPLYHSGFVSNLRQWIDSEDGFDSFLGCMNTSLAPAFMVTLVSKLSTAFLRQTPWATEIMFKTWLADSSATSHSDMLHMARGKEPQLWLFAPFQSRPLGRPLPSILVTCTCPDLLSTSSLRRRAGGRKVWDVRHVNGSDRTPLREVAVRAACIVCKQTWPLPSEHMAGVLRKYLGNCSAVVPYFVRPAPQ